MSKTKTILAAGLGVALGFLVKQQLDENQQSSPENALKNAKEAFKEQGPISGSWIYMKPEVVDKDGLTYTAYRGGVTRKLDGTNKQFEFLADAETGTIIGSTETP